MCPGKGGCIVRRTHMLHLAPLPEGMQSSEVEQLRRVDVQHTTGSRLVPKHR